MGIINKFIIVCTILTASYSFLNGMSLEIANAWKNKSIGEIGEKTMRSYFQDNGWSEIKIPTKNPLNGIDGVFVKRTPSNIIKDVLIVESKVNTSQENYLISGEKQGSKAYNLKKINDGLSLTTDPSLKKDLLKIRDKIEKDLARSIEHRVQLDNRQIRITHRTLLSPIDYPNEIIKGEPRIVADFEYSNPKNLYEKHISESITKETQKFLSNKSLTQTQVDTAVNNLNKNLNSGKGITDSIFSSIKDIPDPRILPEGFKINSPLSRVLGRTLPNTKIQNPASNIALKNSLQKAAVAGGMVFAFESAEALYDYLRGDENLDEFCSKVEKGAIGGALTTATFLPAERILTHANPIEPVLARILPNGNLLCATNAGLFVVSIEMGLASFELWTGHIDSNEFKRKAKESIIKGTAVGGATYVALYFGVNSTGIVPFAIGFGTYLIVDFGIKEYQKNQFIHLTNTAELAALGIINEDNPFEIENPDNPMKIKNPDNPFELQNSDNPFRLMQ